MTNKNEGVEEKVVKNTKVVNEVDNKTSKDKKGKGKFICIVIITILLISGIVYYFVFIKSNNKEKDDTGKILTREGFIDEYKNVKTKNDILDYSSLISKISNSNENILTKCDCSDVQDEGSVDKSVCTNYLVSNNLFLTIVSKLKKSGDAQVLPTGNYCSTYYFSSKDENGRIIFHGFTGNDLKSILVEYSKKGYAFNYDKDLTSFFESIIAFSDKIKIDDDENDGRNDDIKDDEKENNDKITSDEISAIMKTFDKYFLMELIYGDENPTFTKDKIYDVQLEMLETFMIKKYNDSWYDHFDDNSEWSFTKTEADNYFNDLYGFKPSTTYRDLICDNDDEVLLYFKDDKFIWNNDHPGHGGLSSAYIDYSVTDFNVKDNIYTLTISFIYGHEEMGYYINGVSIDTDFEYEDNYDKIMLQYKSYFQEHKDEYKDKAYKYTFEKKNGNYYLKSFSK